MTLPVSEAVSLGARQPRTADSPRRILVISPAFPASVQPTYGVFVKERVKALAAVPGYQVEVVSPIPYFPPIRLAARWYMWSQFLSEETIDDLPVHRPRYPMIPKFGHRFLPRLMQSSVMRVARRIRDRFPFDLIDAHFVYPAGVLAAHLSVAMGVPFVVTGRGEDMCRFPQNPALRPQIELAVKSASHCIAVSQQIADAFVACGAPADRVTVIGNGVDCEKFVPLDRDETRRRLNLSPDLRHIVSVGDRFENKGFHLLIAAVSELRKMGIDVRASIVGGPPRHGRDYTPVLEQQIRDLNLGAHVRLVGRRPHQELAVWYNSADLFVLLSEREGSPNVLMEALACGVPAVATSVGGIPEVLGDSRLGLQVPERNVDSITLSLREALLRSWDRTHIRDTIKRRDWNDVARRVSRIVDDVVDSSESFAE